MDSEASSQRTHARVGVWMCVDVFVQTGEREKLCLSYSSSNLEPLQYPARVCGKVDWNSGSFFVKRNAHTIYVQPDGPQGFASENEITVSHRWEMRRSQSQYKNYFLTAVFDETTIVSVQGTAQSHASSLSGL